MIDNGRLGEEREDARRGGVERVWAGGEGRAFYHTHHGAGEIAVVGGYWGYRGTYAGVVAEVDMWGSKLNRGCGRLVCNINGWHV